MPEYKICNIEVPDGTEIGNYHFKRVTDYEKRRLQLYQPKKEKTSYKITPVYTPEGKSEGLIYRGESASIVPMQYGSHQITAIATPEGPESKSVFADGKTQIYDILLFYNFLQGKNACLADDMAMFIHKDKIGVNFSKQPIVSSIDECLKEICKPEWRDGAKDREILAYLFYLSAKDSNKLQVRYIQFFTCLDMYDTPQPPFEGKIFDSHNFPQPVTQFDNIVEAIRIIRNKYVHTGHCTLSDFSSEVFKPKSKATTSFRNFVSNLKGNDFDKFQCDCSYMLDAYLYWVFCIIFGIANKIDRTRADFKHYMGQELNNRLEVFRKMAGE